MGQRGPAPRPTALKLLQGVDRHNPNRVNRAEPKPAASKGQPVQFFPNPKLKK